MLEAVLPGKFLGIYKLVGQDPSDSKSSRLHADIIFRFCFHSFDEVSSTLVTRALHEPKRIVQLGHGCARGPSTARIGRGQGRAGQGGRAGRPVL